MYLEMDAKKLDTCHYVQGAAELPKVPSKNQGLLFVCHVLIHLRSRPP